MYIRPKSKVWTNVVPFFCHFSPRATGNSHVALAPYQSIGLWAVFPLGHAVLPVLIQHHPVESECTWPLGLACGPIQLSFTSFTPHLYDSFWLFACIFLFPFFILFSFIFIWFSFLSSPFPLVLPVSSSCFLKPHSYFVSPLISLSSV